MSHWNYSAVDSAAAIVQSHFAASHFLFDIVVLLGSDWL